MLRLPRRLAVLLLMAPVVAHAQESSPHPHADAPADVMPVPVVVRTASPSPLYRCDPSADTQGRRCASTAIPGAIPLYSAPQFFVLAVDDCLKPETERQVRSLVDGTLRNPDGRPIPITYFLSLERCQTGGVTDPALVQQRYRAGDEIAVHTTTHTTYDTTSAAVWRSELEGVRTYLRTLGLGPDAGRGFRAPRTATNPALFDVLHELDFLYDSSIYDSPHWSQVSQGVDRFVWPYTYDHWAADFAGRAQQCEHFIRENKCARKPLPGLWEVPLYQYVSSADPHKSEFYGAFDVGNPVYNPGAANLPEGALIGMLDFHFNARYNGNRAPMTFNFHPPTLERQHLRHGYRVILEAALSRSDVWAVTMQGLLEWVQNPVPASEMTEWYADYCTRHPCAPRTSTAADTPEAAPAEPLRVFPNPTTGAATAEVHTQAPGATLTVHTLLGHAVQHQVLPAAGLQRVHLNLSDLAAGLYVVRVKDGAHVRAHKLVRH